MSATVRSGGTPRLCRIAVVGTTGSGKTTLAKRIALLLGLPHVELDALHWGPNWTEASAELFRDRTAAALSGDRWVVDGNYSGVRDMIWGKADTVVWLDYPLWLIMGQLLWRTCRRVFTRQQLWGGNRESFRAQFLSKDSLLVYAWRSYRRRRQEYPLLLSQPQHAHLRAVRLRSPGEAQRWLAGLAPLSDGSPSHGP